MADAAPDEVFPGLALIAVPIAEPGEAILLDQNHLVDQGAQYVLGAGAQLRVRIEHPAVVGVIEVVDLGKWNSHAVREWASWSVGPEPGPLVARSQG